MPQRLTKKQRVLKDLETWTERDEELARIDPHYFDAARALQERNKLTWTSRFLGEDEAARFRFDCTVWWLNRITEPKTIFQALMVPVKVFGLGSFFFGLDVLRYIARCLIYGQTEREYGDDV